MDISLSKLPWYGQIGAFVLVTAVGAGLFYYQYELPAQADLEARRGQLTALRAEIAKGQATEKKLPEFRAEVDALEARLVGLSEVLPEDKDAAELLRQMQAVAVQSNLVIKGFKPSPAVTKQLHAEWPIGLELDGTYHNLALFFDRIGKFSRIVNVSGLVVRAKERGADARSTITATCVATTFVLLDKAVPKKGAAETPPKSPAVRKAA
ncbi:MAG: type 4a pilus biogenesis protein PilO [Vicinamibacterales bacterium]